VQKYFFSGGLPQPKLYPMRVLNLAANFLPQYSEHRFFNVGPTAGRTELT
jgi:hypothetical protein